MLLKTTGRRGTILVLIMKLPLVALVSSRTASSNQRPQEKPMFMNTNSAAPERRPSPVAVNACRCLHCLQLEGHPDKRLHHQLNVLLSHLNEQERRWVAAHEAKRLGWGGQKLVSLITGLDPATILRGQRELDNELEGHPSGRARLPG